MHRSYVDPDCWQGETIKLGLEEEHHLLDVLRARDGDAIEVFDGCGHMCHATIKLLTPQPAGKLNTQRALLHAIDGTHRDVAQGLRITLVQSILKHDRMDLVLEKATELGVSEIIPVITDRVVVRIDDARREERRQRWQRIALGAAKQCHCSHIPDIRPIVLLSSALQYAAKWGIFIVGSLAAGAKPLKDTLESAVGVNHVCLLVGPEGDLAPDEYQCAIHAGGVPVTLGSQVLRSETASIYMLSAIRYALEVSTSSNPNIAPK